MTMAVGNSNSIGSAVLSALVLSLVGCGDAEVFLPVPELGGPAGVIQGTVVYTGKPPCTRAGRVVGVVGLFAFEEHQLPPPEGLASRPVAFNVIGGDELFRGYHHLLPEDERGRLRCADASSTAVTASVPFTLGPLPAGVYQVRAFYDIDGNFDPLFSIFSQPTLGDVAGGAIDNALAVASAGAVPKYRRIGLGEVGQDGSRTMPETGDWVDGVTVTLGLELPLERPRFYLKGVRDAFWGNDDPNRVVLPSDYQLEMSSADDLLATERSFIELIVGAGVAPAEREAAGTSPFFFSSSPPPSLMHGLFDADRNGLIDARDHVAGLPMLPMLQPLGALSLIAPAGEGQPRVVLQTLTLFDGLLGTAAAAREPAMQVFRDETVLALQPAALCFDPVEHEAPAVLVMSHDRDRRGNLLLPDPEAFKRTLSMRLGRPVQIAVGCLPQGPYALSLGYSTGQTWTIPNEAGVCAPGESPAAAGARCGSRARLASQGVTVLIGQPGDERYCVAHPTPRACLPAQ